MLVLGGGDVGEGGSISEEDVLCRLVLSADPSAEASEEQEDDREVDEIKEIGGEFKLVAGRSAQLLIFGNSITGCSLVAKEGFELLRSLSCSWALGMGGGDTERLARVQGRDLVGESESDKGGINDCWLALLRSCSKCKGDEEVEDIGGDPSSSRELKDLNEGEGDLMEDPMEEKASPCNEVLLPTLLTGNRSLLSTLTCSLWSIARSSEV